MSRLCKSESEDGGSEEDKESDTHSDNNSFSSDNQLEVEVITSTDDFLFDYHATVRPCLLTMQLNRSQYGCIMTGQVPVTGEGFHQPQQQKIGCVTKRDKWNVFFSNLLFRV